MARNRRTPAQVASDELATTEKMLAAAKARRAHLDAEAVKVDARIARLQAQRDWQAANPLLATLPEDVVAAPRTDA